MHTSRIFFKFSDLLFHYPRNYKKYKSVITQKNLSFDDRFGNFTEGDIYYDPSKKSKKYPIFVNVHGGGFVRGDKKHRSGFARYIADKGYFVFNINHRLAPEYKFPAGIEDTINALNFVLTLAEKYDLDTEKIVVSGDSAGAYYAAGAVASICDINFQKKLSLPKFKGKVAALVTFCGLFDPLKSMWRNTPFGVAKDVANCLLGMELKDDLSNLKDFEFFEEINIINYVNKQWPKTFLVMAEKDSFCGGQGELLEEKLKAVGVDVRSYIAKSYDEFHCFHLLPFLKATKVCMDKASQFLNELIEKN